LYVSASGYIATVGLHNEKIQYSSFRVPMDFDRLQVEVFADRASFNNEWFRVQDILIKTESTPDTATLYVSHNVFEPENSEICSVISRTRLDTSGGDIKLVDGIWEEFYRIRECVSMEEFDWAYYGLESGGKLLLLDDKHILMGVGDYGIEWELFTHDRVGLQHENDFSKIMSINIETGKSEVYANGVRNPQGLTLDSDGQIWEAEHGPQGGDEINHVLKGADLGWPTVSLGMNYGNPRNSIPTNPVQGRHDGFIKPVMAFMPSIGISALAGIPAEPNAFTLWAGDLLAVSLRAQSLYHLRRDENRIIYAERIELGVRLRDVIILDNGWIAVLTGGDRSIILLRDVPADGKAPVEPIQLTGYGAVNELQGTILAKLGDPSPERSIFRTKCASCHSVNGESRVGPPLNGVFGRRIGSVEGFDFSEDLASARGKWTKAKLLEFAEDPQAMYPGSFMPAQDTLEPYQRRAITKYLSELD